LEASALCHPQKASICPVPTGSRYCLYKRRISRDPEGQMSMANMQPETGRQAARDRQACSQRQADRRLPGPGTGRGEADPVRLSLTRLNIMSLPRLNILSLTRRQRQTPPPCQGRLRRPGSGVNKTGFNKWCKQEWRTGRLGREYPERATHTGHSRACTPCKQISCERFTGV
jgi:hypothetical protein